MYNVFQKSDAKIEITITTSNLIRIKHPFSDFNYWLSGETLQISTKSITQFLSNSRLEMELKNRSFQSGKYQLAYSLHEVLRVMM